MPNKKTPSQASAPSEPEGKITAEALQILLKEFDTMRDLFSETQVSIQGIFNFYITLITAIIGGIALVLQPAAGTAAGRLQSQIIICGLLILATIIGTIYLLSIVYRYSRLVEYGRNLDALRSHLIRELRVPVPPEYTQFLQKTKEQAASRTKAKASWLAWLLPAGTYQLTMAFINSCALSIATWILLSITGAASTRFYDSLGTVLVEFILVFNIYNIYSRITLKYWESSFRLHLDPHIESPFRMIR